MQFLQTPQKNKEIFQHSTEKRSRIGHSILLMKQWYQNKKAQCHSGNRRKIRRMAQIESLCKFMNY